MTQEIADRRDVDFVLYEQLQVEDLSHYEKYQDFNKETINDIVSAAQKLAIKEILPTRVDGDRVGAEFANGKVTVPESYHKAWKLIQDGGWIAVSETPEVGGMGAPQVVGLATREYMHGANNSLMGWVAVTHGAGKLVEVYGTTEQKELYLEKLFSGQWAGTMLLTEPQAGSDVGALTTSAVENSDGTYSIVGNKIFISCGEHDLTENIILPILARIEGAPAGTKGLSLFLASKYLPGNDGTLGEMNDIVCAGLEDKMGLHGNPTCSMVLGSEGKCIGTLLGEKNKGMQVMFLMMNEARLNVALQGYVHASASYLYALGYARERIQGQHILDKRRENPVSVPIIQHPDIRRMLLQMKVYVDGMRSMLYYIALCFDKCEIGDEAEKVKYQGLTELLTPIAKAYVTDRSFEVCVTAMQVYGGYGYMREYPIEQLLRDCKINSIYEGANGIQAMDLLGRKLGMNGGKVYMDLATEIRATIARAEKNERTKSLADNLANALDAFDKTVKSISALSRSEKVLNAYAHACPFLDVTGDIVMAWQLLWRAVVSAEEINADLRTEEVAFYEGQLKGAEFFINTVLPVTKGRMDSITIANGATIEISEESFGGE
jgi:alkylation response protein AidB-like acyl-CoA dehydrogenase